MSKNHLFIREWLVSFVVLGLVGSLFFAVSSPSTILPVDDVVSQDIPITITVKGLVEFPGVYRAPPGTTLKEIMRKAKPLSGSDAEGLYLKKVVLDSSSVEVVEKKDKKKRAKKH